MRELHVVALSEDGRHVVLATRAGAPSGEFRVALDERLTAAVKGELPPPGRETPPSISPRDIQARLRDGESPEQIAASAGVPLSRVERYAGPVLAELDRMVTGARSAVVIRPRLGPSAVPLGEAVEARLAEVAHLAEGSVRWTARRTDVGQWVVEVSWTARGRRRTAGWLYDPVSREVTAVDGPSAVLGHLESEASAGPVGARGARPAAAAPAGRSGRSRPAAATTAARRSAGTSATGAPATRAPGTPGPADVGQAAARTTRAADAPASRSSAGTARAGVATDRPAQPGHAPAAAAGPARTTSGSAGAAAVAPATVRRARPRPATPAPGTGTPRPASAAPEAPAPRRRAGGTQARRAPGQQSPDATPAADRVQPRRPALKRRPVPSLDELATTHDTTTQDTTTQDTADHDTTATGSGPTVPPSGAASATPVPPGPPVLRVVPPADAEPASVPQAADDAEAPPQARPARRAAGARGGGRDWADVLMGGAPAPPAAEPPRD